MKIVWFLVYPIVVSIAAFLIFAILSVFKKMATMSIKELNDAKKTDRADLEEKETIIIRRIGIIIFMLGGNLVWAIFGATFGAIAREITTQSFFRWIAYIFVYFLMISIFRIIHKTISKKFEVFPFLEMVFFSLMMIFMFILSVCCESNVPTLFSWHLVF